MKSMPTPKTSQQVKMRQAFRILMATILVCGALSIGSIVGVMAVTLQGGKPQYRTVINKVTGKEEVVKTEPAIDLAQMIWNYGPLERRMNILILGSDYNYSYGKRVDDAVAGVRSRTDTIMLASLDPETGQASILSIPRDTRALLTGYHYDKINAAMTYGGVDLVKSTVSDLIGVPVDYYMALKVDGLINTIDILGGIRMYVEKDMYYVDETAHLGINIHKGWKENMNGEQAHQYVRFRKDELGDIGRVQRQQKFIRATLDKLLQPQSIPKIPQLLTHLNENIETDIPGDIMGQLVHFGKNLDKQKMRMVMLPGSFSTIDGISFWQPSIYKMRKMINDMFPDSTFAQDPTTDFTSDEGERDPANYRVAIWNATEDIRTFKEVSRRLQEAGFRVVNIRKAPHDTPVTKIIAQNGETDILPLIQKPLEFTTEYVNASVGDLTTDFTVLIGKDLVKHYNNILTEEDWARSARQVIPQAPRRVIRRRRAAPPAAAPEAPADVNSAAPKRTTRNVPQTPRQPLNVSQDAANTIQELEPTLPRSAGGSMDSKPRRSRPLNVPPENFDANTVDPLFD